MATPSVESDADLSTGAAVRKRKRRRSPGGLGRGLARILTDANTRPEVGDRHRPGLVQLVGGRPSAKTTRVQRFVVETALATMADGFSLDGVVLATRGRESSEHVGRSVGPVSLTASFPASWSVDSPALLQIYGNLWEDLQDERQSTGSSVDRRGPTERVVPTEHRQIPVGRHWVWMARLDDGDQSTAAAAIRTASFSPLEAEALATVMGSLVAACSESAARAAARRLIQDNTAISLKSEGQDVLAEVNAHWELAANGGPAGRPSRRTGLGRGPDPTTAVARAAAKACRPRCEIAFAGTSELEEGEVSIVMIRDQRQGLRLGYALREKGDHGGVAEAVFTAAG